MLSSRSALAATGPGLVNRFDKAGLRTCHATCGTLATNFLTSLRGGPYTALFDACVVIMYLAPALMGIFWGAPLIAREFETGTHRLVWNQTVTRTRWAAVKLGLIGLAAMAVAGLLSLMIGWWGSPIDHAMNFGQPNSGTGYPRLSPLVFAARGVAPLGYAAFAFVLGVTAGVLIRKTLPAMAITLVIFAAIQLLMPNFVRPHLISPVQVTAPFNANKNNELMISAPSNQMTVVGGFNQPGAWILSNKHNHAIRPGLHGPGHSRVPKQLANRLRQLAEQPAPAAAGQLPAGQQVLAAPGHRDRDLPDPRRRARLALRLADPSQARMTSALAGRNSS